MSLRNGLLLVLVINVTTLKQNQNNSKYNKDHRWCLVNKHLGDEQLRKVKEREKRNPGQGGRNTLATLCHALLDIDTHSHHNSSCCEGGDGGDGREGREGRRGVDVCLVLHPADCSVDDCSCTHETSDDDIHQGSHVRVSV